MALDPDLVWHSCEGAKFTLMKERLHFQASKAMCRSKGGKVAELLTLQELICVNRLLQEAVADGVRRVWVDVQRLYDDTCGVLVNTPTRKGMTKINCSDKAMSICKKNK